MVEGKETLYITNHVIIYGQASKRRTSKDLVEKDLDVINGQRLLGHYDTMKVALHQFCGNIPATLLRIYSILLSTLSKAVLTNHKNPTETIWCQDAQFLWASEVQIQ